MVEIKQGQSITLNFKHRLDVNLDQVSYISITFKQNNEPVIKKTGSSVRYGSETITVELSEKDTKEFNIYSGQIDPYVSLQIKVKDTSGKSHVSNIINIRLIEGYDQE